MTVSIRRLGLLGLEILSDDCSVKVSCDLLDCEVIASGQCQWEEVGVPSVRGTKRGYLIEVEGVRVLHAGPISEPVELPPSDVIALPMGGLWYLSAFEACELVKSGPWRVVVPLAYWSPGTKYPFDTENMVKDLCRGMNRVRASKYWHLKFDRLKKTLVLVSVR